MPGLRPRLFPKNSKTFSAGQPAKAVHVLSDRLAPSFIPEASFITIRKIPAGLNIEEWAKNFKKCLMPDFRP